MAWTEDFSDRGLKGNGAADVLGAIGVILPWLTGIAPILTPLAAVGLALLQFGAMIEHSRRKEYKILPVNAMLFLLAAFVAFGRFIGYPPA